MTALSNIIGTASAKHLDALNRTQHRLHGLYTDKSALLLDSEMMLHIRANWAQQRNHLLLVESNFEFSLPIALF